MASVFPQAYQTFVRELKKARESNGLTQDDITETLGLYKTFMSKVESGERRVDVVELISICRVMGIDPGEFVSRVSRQIKRF